MSTNFFSSLNGQFDLNSSMSSLYGDYSQIKSVAYGSLMKSYVNKVGNKSALKAYQETGSTTTGTDSATTTTSTSKKSYASKSNFLDSHLSSIGKSSSSSESSSTKKSFLDSHLDDVLGTKDTKSTSTDTPSDPVTTTNKDGSTTTTVTYASSTDKYQQYKSSWLDDQLKQYDKDANKTTAADASIGLDTTI